MDWTANTELQYPIFIKIVGEVLKSFQSIGVSNVKDEFLKYLNTYSCLDANIERFAYKHFSVNCVQIFFIESSTLRCSCEG